MKITRDFKKNNIQLNSDDEEEADEENFEFINIGIFYYTYSDNMINNVNYVQKNKNDFTYRFDILENFNDMKNFNLELINTNHTINNNENENIKNGKKSNCNYENFEHNNTKEQKTLTANLNQKINDDIKANNLEVEDQKEQEEGKKENISENKEILLKSKRAYFNVYFRKIKLFENEKKNNNDISKSSSQLKMNVSAGNNNNINKNKEEYLVEFVLIDISKEIRYHKKIINQSIKIHKMQNALENELIMPFMNLSYLINKLNSDDSHEKIKKRIQAVNNIDVYLKSNISFNKSFPRKNQFRFNNEVNINIKSIQKPNLQKIRFKIFFNFLKEICFNFLNCNFLKYSNVRFEFKSELKNIENYVVSSDENVFKEIMLQLLTNVIKYNDNGVIYIVVTEGIFEEKENIQVLFRFTKENILNPTTKTKMKIEVLKHQINKYNNSFLDDENPIITNYYKNIFENDVSLRIEEGLVNPFNNMNFNKENYTNINKDNNNDSAEDSAGGITKVNFNMNNNNYINKENKGLKNYFLTIYKKTLLKNIIKKENLWLGKIKKLLKSMRIEFQFTNDYIYGKEFNLKFFIPFQLEEEPIFRISNYMSSNDKILNGQSVNSNSESLSISLSLQNEETILSFNPGKSKFNNNHYDKTKSHEKSESLENLEYLSPVAKMNKRDSTNGSINIDQYLNNHQNIIQEDETIIYEEVTTKKKFIFNLFHKFNFK